jgi:hypothetical protein
MPGSLTLIAGEEVYSLPLAPLTVAEAVSTWFSAEQSPSVELGVESGP